MTAFAFQASRVNPAFPPTLAPNPRTWISEMPDDTILVQVENQLLSIPGVNRTLAQSAARTIAFGDSLRPRSPEERAVVLAVYQKLVRFLQG